MTDQFREHLEQAQYVRVRQDSELVPLERATVPPTYLEILGYGAFAFIVLFGIGCLVFPSV